MKFTKDMIGRTVRQVSTGDVGIVTKQIITPLFPEDCSGNEYVYVQWTTGEEAGSELYIGLDQIEFVDRLISDTVIVEIAGIKYKLVPL